MAPQNETPTYEKAAEELIEIGRQWLDRGLIIGKTAIEVASDGIRATGEGLGRVAELIDTRVDEIVEDARG